MKRTHSVTLLVLGSASTLLLSSCSLRKNATADSDQQEPSDRVGHASRGLPAGTDPLPARGLRLGADVQPATVAKRSLSREDAVVNGPVADGADQLAGLTAVQEPPFPADPDSPTAGTDAAADLAAASAADAALLAGADGSAGAGSPLGHATTIGDVNNADNTGRIGGAVANGGSPQVQSDMRFRGQLLGRVTATELLQRQTAGTEPAPAPAAAGLGAPVAGGVSTPLMPTAPTMSTTPIAPTTELASVPPPAPAPSMVPPFSPGAVPPVPGPASAPANTLQPIQTAAAVRLRDAATGAGFVAAQSTLPSAGAGATPAIPSGPLTSEDEHLEASASVVQGAK